MGNIFSKVFGIGTETGWNGQVTAFADLPVATAHTGELYLVLTSTGLLWNRRKGLYRSDGVNWDRVSNATFEVLDSEATFSDNGDVTKKMKFDLASITTGNTRYIEMSDYDQDLTTPLFDYIDFNLATTVAHQEGRLHWNSDDGTLEVGMPGGNVILQIGQEQLLKVKNDTGSTILNGSVVYINGASGVNPTIALADADNISTAYVLGMATEDILTFGFVNLMGAVRAINTDPATYNGGDVLWLSQTAGGFTKVKPDAPAISVFIGYVVRPHATEGIVVIRPTVVPRLTALSDVNDATVNTNGQILEWDNDNSYFDFTKNINDYTTRSEWYQNGFKDVDGGNPNNDILITFNNTTRTLSLAPTGTSFIYYRLGYAYTETATLTKVLGTGIAGDDGLWVFYIDSTGLSSAQNPSHDAVDDVIEKTCIVAYVMWDAVNNLGKLMWEAHGMNMSPFTHHWLHDNIGAVYREGMALSGFTDIGGDGDQDTDVQFNISAGIFYDEDIEHGVNAIAIGDSYDLWYLEGSNWRWISTTMPGREHPDGMLAWNDAGTQTEADNGDYVCAHIFATNIMTNAGSTTREYIFIQGQAEYDSSKLARAGADVEINTLVYGTLPLEEIVPVATIILQTGTGMSNGISASIEYTESGDEFIDWRGSDLKASGGSISDHGSLAGLTDNDHPQYAQIINNLSDVNNIQTSLNNVTAVSPATN